MAQPPASSRRPILALPPEPTPFIGRGAEIARLHDKLASARLLTIVGPPGIGKTRAALRVATSSEMPAWFCDLSASRNEADVCSVVARMFGVALADEPARALGMRLDRVGDAILVLDNFEQLVETALDAVSIWLESAPRLRIVVTSRERLRLRPELVFELGPLATSVAGDTLADAGQLFVDRARAHRPDFRVAGADTETLGALVAALEGNPLAIELAAARVDALGLRGLHERMSKQLELLSRGARDNHRQATIWAAIDASWQLLDDAQRRALGRLAVFEGGFDLAAAEAVVGPDALDRIQDLRDRSLVRPPQGGRFTIYRSIREFAERQEEVTRDRAAAEEAHQAHFLRIGEVAARRFAREGAAIDALAADRDNLIAVFERTAAAEQLEVAKRAVKALTPILATRGPARFQLDLLRRLGPLTEEDPALLHTRALAKRTVGDLEGAHRDLDAGLDIAVGDDRDVRWLRANMEKDRGVLHHQQRHIDRARSCYEDALSATGALGDRRLEGIITGNLGALAHDVGRFEEAATRYRTALDRLREVSDARLEGIFWTNLGVLEQEEGRTRRARKHYEQALVLLEKTADIRFEAIARGNLGVLEHEQGNHDAARARHEEALALLLEVGDAGSEALCRARLGAVLAELAEVDAAEDQLDEAERLVVGRDELALSLVRLHRSFVELAAGEPDKALSRIEAAQARTGDEPSLAEVSDDARMLLRMLAKADKRGTGTRLEVGPSAEWFRAPGGTRQSLEKYAAARQILERLTVERLGEGRALDSAELFAAGWPGVTIATQSANNRLYVALAKLRKMGLKLFLLRTDEGYRLDPDTPVWRAADT